MRNAGLLLIGLALLVAGAALRGAGAPARDGVFIHISHGSDDPHRALMALKMAEIMQEQRDVLVYFDIKGVEVCLKGAPDIQYSYFDASKEQMQKLLDRKVTIMVCPTCLRAAGRVPDDLAPGIQVADKDRFFTFTEGRILTVDY
jgi:predicted peroxiredoxin